MSSPFQARDKPLEDMETDNPMRNRFIYAAALFCSITGLSRAEDVAPGYSEQVAPLLKKDCAGCHNDDDREGDLSLESFASLQKGTPEGPALLAGDAANSKLIRVLTGAADVSMPPEGEPRPSDEEIALLKAWIDAGAKGPDGAEPDRATLIVPRIESHADIRPVAAVDWSADGRLVAVARFGEVTLHAAEELKQSQESGVGSQGRPQVTLGPFAGKVNAVHFTPDGQRLVTASGVAGLVGKAAIWNVADGTLVREFTGHRDILYDAELSSDGTVLATCSYDRRIILWNAQTGEELRALEGHNGAVYDVAFSPDGMALVSASADDTCKVWRVSDGERLDTLGQPLKEQYAVTFSPDGRFIVAGGADNRIRVWRFVSRQRPRINPLVHARFAHEGPIVRLAFTPDGSKLVSIAEDRTLKLWETKGYTELHLYETQPDVAMALAIAGDGKAFLVGRLNGSLQSFPIAASRGRRADDGTQVVTSVPMTDVGPVTQAAEQEPNDTLEHATRIAVPAQVTGAIHHAQIGKPDGGDQSPSTSHQSPDLDLYRFSARAGQEWVIEINAARSQSPLDSYVEVLGADGQRIERVLLQAVRDSYFTFRGKDASGSDDFRVFNWEEMELNEYFYAEGEVVKLWLYPRGPDSGFMVYPGQGNRWGFFDTTPLAHPLGAPCYVVEPFAPGTELIPNGLPVFTLYYENDDESRRSLGKDSRVTFVAPADGEYVVKVRDVRGEQGAEFKYTLSVRPRQPDFKVTLHGANPTVNAGSAKEFKVTVQRLDDYDGPIRIDIDGLPPGFHATTPVVIQEGQIEAFGVLWADTDAPAPTPENAKATKVTATATIGEREVAHEVNNFGEIKRADPSKAVVSIVPAEGGAAPVAAPEDGPLEFVIHPGETIMLKARVARSEYKGNVPFGNADSGRNLPHGVYVDNIGLNGLLILEDLDEREFFVTAAKWVPEQSRMFHLKTDIEGGQATRPVIVHVRKADAVAER